MARDASGREAPTRREYVKYGGAVVGGGLLAGCTGGSGGGSTPDATATESGTSTPSATEDTGYSVTMSPVGTVEFERPPETATVYDATWADALVGLGHGDAVLSLGHPENYYAGYYDQLDGVSFDPSELAPLYNDGLDKEQFYELDADVHHLDPVNIGYSGWSGWSMRDVEEIESNVGPFFANRLSRAHSDPPGEYGGEYEYYSLWELTEKLGQVYRETERAAELKAIRDDLVDEITADLPSRSDRPSVGLLVFTPDQEAFSPYRINAPGYGKAQFRPFDVEDAFADSDKTYAENYEGSYDVEGLLEIDPDVIVHNWDVEPSERTRAMREFFADSPVAQELTAVQDDRVYVGGTPTQGPVMNVFQIEMTAKQLFPEQFGEWKGVGQHDPSERLFDRDRLATAITGGN
ncbi:ABC-type Fe3+-hydroxamate transport system, substrate-binding protein [Halomicrobium zhouii]|uniref:ABC-type Fe3+-hydroxamate transport system, substrate-binding protein n=1 Tax=Halomicrobium zhouii TaxID=767519 RepID=A0A1I6KJN7_9EURY|nr:ABC transporter substrate-binding protein [Halomicrobium zhouii]SFR91070.1 ABC-type Fe3+-hydroxamate transport system, substrate-binding protein [Halomicrobium zhouii]